MFVGYAETSKAWRFFEPTTATLDYELPRSTTVTAYLNASLAEETYITQPLGFAKYNDGRVLLHRAL
jgi:hypothetical protein